MKKNKKLISALMTITCLLLMSNMVLGTEGILGEIDGKGSIENEGIKGMIAQILGMVSSFAMACTTGMLLYLGVKYTMASANEKADLKSGSIKYLIGAVIVFAAAAVFKIIETVIAEVGSEL